MPIKQKGHRLDISKKIDSLTTNVKNALAYNLSFVGEKAYNVAVNLPSPPASMRGNRTRPTTSTTPPTCEIPSVTWL